MSIKPFYVYKPTHAEAVEIVERAIANGARRWHLVEGMDTTYSNSFKFDDDDYWGVDDDGDTANTPRHMYGDNAAELTMQQVRELLPCEKCDAVKAVEWNGEGLPPVGTVCELSLDGGEFKWCAVRFVGKKIVVVDHKNYSEQTYKPTDIEFRPLRTKRDKWIDRTIMFFYEDCEKTRTILGEIYDAGLAKDIDE